MIFTRLTNQLENFGNSSNVSYRGMKSKRSNLHKFSALFLYTPFASFPAKFSQLASPSLSSAFTKGVPPNRNFRAFLNLSYLSLKHPMMLLGEFDVARNVRGMMYEEWSSDLLQYLFTDLVYSFIMYLCRCIPTRNVNLWIRLHDNI